MTQQTRSNGQRSSDKNKGGRKMGKNIVKSSTEKQMLSGNLFKIKMTDGQDKDSGQQR